MKSGRRFSAAAVVLAVAVFTATPAYAVFDSAAIVAAIVAAQSALTSALSLRTEFLRSSLVTALQGSTQVLAREEARGASMVAGTVSQVETGLEGVRTEARWTESDECAVLAPTQGTASALRSTVGLGGGVGRGGSGGGSAGSQRLSSNMRDVLDVSAGRALAPELEVTAAKGAQGACNSFASTATPNRARWMACQDAGSGFSPNSTNGTPDADVRAETLFQGPQASADPKLFRRRLTIDTDSPDQVAVEALMRNLSTPVDLRQLRKAELQTDAGRQYMSFRDAYDARMNVAERPARALAASRLANPDLIPMLQQLVAGESSGTLVKAYLQTNAPNWATRGISIDEMFNMEAERRYLNPQWYLTMAAKPPETHVREQTDMMALQTLLLVRMLEKLDTLAVVNGQVAASNVRAEMLPQLISLHKAVAK